MSLASLAYQSISLDRVLIGLPFIDYTHFEVNPLAREVAKAGFLRDRSWVPHYTYPKLWKFYDDGSGSRNVMQKTAFMREAMKVLDQAESGGELDRDLSILYQEYYDTHLKRVMLVDAARGLQMAQDAAQQVTARRRFNILNQELFGDINRELWLGIMNSVATSVRTFQPRNNSAKLLKQYLEDALGDMTSTITEFDVYDEQLAADFKPFLEQRYADILSVVPSDFGGKFDATECAEIMTRALHQGGLATWKTEVDKTKINPATSFGKERIYLPTSTSRTADELKRLIIHEQEVHARRGYNGELSGIPLLGFGTANFTPAEEGLGVFMEMILAGSADNPAVHRARDRYITAGLALGVDSGIYRDARSTFEILWRIILLRHCQTNGKSCDELESLAKEQAYTHIENAFRGTSFDAPGVIYLKLKVYYEGLVKNVQLMRQIGANTEAFDQLFVGKYDHTDETERQLITSIIERGISP